jgi:hypothetical protein
VEILEGGPGQPAPAATVPVPRPDCAGVERLKMSMTEAEVRRILGEPSKVDATPLQTRWRYGCGTAYFDADTKRFVGFERAN